MTVLNKEQVKNLHRVLIDQTGGADGIRDEGLLESALFSPFQTFEGKELYSSTAAKIARIAYSLVNNHPFVDGNKRIGDRHGGGTGNRHKYSVSMGAGISSKEQYAELR